ncbi:hypothetical protein V8J38_16660 (plasmid) [Brevundimonas olei]|uniref:Uncharacterized protein n=1 Tax=Brevundimonas olei TaxID=657642 RepID=A0ABZ2IHY0_9CAUL
MSQADFMSRLVNRDRIRVTMRDGTVHIGAYMTVAGMAFVLVRKPGAWLDETIGPLTADLVESVSVERAWRDIETERWHKARGERFPGAEPLTAMDYEYRLQRMARAIAAEEDPIRRSQLARQFDDLADAIRLGGGKRAWVRAEGAWSLTSNAPPTLSDLWCSDVASPAYMARPRPQDFDPDPAVRRRRLRLPAEVAEDPRSVPNVLRSLVRAGFRARLALAGDPRYRRGVIQIDLRPGRTGRFLAEAKPQGDTTAWDLSWGGNHNTTALRQASSARRLPAYQELKRLIPSERRFS